ncbi:uncharacterized protein A4U43_C03F26370 [Asparagus officinalis]|uniref:LysM domain-containing protein n=1 Tax=Asparagus officinalis TaxID=4686 RepID=A0A5P1FI52_ASPOF|nr:uncharacterized protein A4U43_C03F26370 [Asparagus officinalis]
MAKAAALLFSLALVISLLLICMAEGRIFADETPQTPSCEAIHGVKANETCFSVQQVFKLTPGEFGAINPNLVCDKLFIGQWLCVAGSS